MAVKDVIRENSPEWSNILYAMIKFVESKTAMMIHQAQTGRKAHTSPKEIAL